MPKPHTLRFLPASPGRGPIRRGCYRRLPHCLTDQGAGFARLPSVSDRRLPMPRRLAYCGP